MTFAVAIPAAALATAAAAAIILVAIAARASRAIAAIVAAILAHEAALLVAGRHAPAAAIAAAIIVIIVITGRAAAPAVFLIVLLCHHSLLSVVPFWLIERGRAGSALLLHALRDFLPALGDFLAQSLDIDPGFHGSIEYAVSALFLFGDMMLDIFGEHLHLRVEIGGIGGTAAQLREQELAAVMLDLRLLQHVHFHLAATGGIEDFFLYPAVGQKFLGDLFDKIRPGVLIVLCLFIALEQRFHLPVIRLQQADGVLTCFLAARFLADCGGACFGLLSGRCFLGKVGGGSLLLVRFLLFVLAVVPAAALLFACRPGHARPPFSRSARRRVEQGEHLLARMVRGIVILLNPSWRLR